MKVLLLPQAQEDLDSISDPLFSRILKRLKDLGEFPEIGAPMSGLFFGYRSLIVDLFRVVYRISSKDQVVVAYIRDCRRRHLS